MRKAIALLALALIALPIAAQPMKIAQSQRELGPIVVTELAIRDGKLVFRTDSGGCTDAGSFTVDVVKEEGIAAKVPHYRLTIRRIRIDECKSMLLDGVLIELDLEKDLGLKGTCTISVANPVYQRPRAEESAADLRESLRRSTVKAIELEIGAYTEKLRVAEEGTGPEENKAKFRQKIEDLEAERVRFIRMQPGEYPKPVKPTASPSSVLDEATAYGPMVPAELREVVVVVSEPCSIGGLLPVEGSSRSGPFFHLAGIQGGDAGILKPGKRYQLTVYLVYRREYFGFIGDYYVYVAGVR